MYLVHTYRLCRAGQTTQTHRSTHTHEPYMDSDEDRSDTDEGPWSSLYRYIQRFSEILPTATVKAQNAHAHTFTAYTHCTYIHVYKINKKTNQITQKSNNNKKNVYTTCMRICVYTPVYLDCELRELAEPS